ncbi:MAG TPA: metal ABC transporter permease [Phycisphaerae bacterium]|nr:metal ABC transporter permease [Phycisphaerae bacterium]HOJ72575.1 metal ABC transporter permease [Phycisphaerae bacterium]HOM49764.1 metal ABC transporter permease [Phycisphaerae bacterium]HON67440.1 metal ABC transporter permease [Phycisphaerae bacterium]HOQ86743.1 metal ABC transporter permease [Phycisphaerae bacterium]
MIAQLPGLEWWSQMVQPLLERGVRSLMPEAWQHYAFMHRAIIECILIAPMCAAMGVKVVNFRMAFFSDAISHSAFAGVAFGFLLHDAITRFSFDPRIAMVIFGVMVGLGIAMVRRRTDLSNDTVIGVFFSTVVAIGIAIITAFPKHSAEFPKYLYGSILTLDDADLYVSALLAVGMLVFMLLSFNPLMLIGLNSELAHSRRIRVRLYDYLFAMLLALVIMTLIRTAGILLVTAMLVVPAAAARNLARSVSGMFWWATLIALISSVAGTLVSFSDALSYVGTGAVIVLAAAVIFAVSLLAKEG